MRATSTDNRKVIRINRGHKAPLRPPMWGGIGLSGINRFLGSIYERPSYRGCHEIRLQSHIKRLFWAIRLPTMIPTTTSSKGDTLIRECWQSLRHCKRMESGKVAQPPPRRYKNIFTMSHRVGSFCCRHRNDNNTEEINWQFQKRKAHKTYFPFTML